MDQALENLREEFEQKKKELEKLRSELNSVSDKKEALFAALRSINDSISKHREEINKLKEARDSITHEVKELKQKRDQFNSIMREKSSFKKEIEAKKGKFSADLPFSNPERVKEKIEQLEKKIETEVLPFNKEKEIYKQIKSLQETYKKVSQLEAVGKELNSASADFSQIKRLAQESHQQVQEKADFSQEKHKLINGLYEEIRELRKQEKPIAEDYLKTKIEYHKLKDSFKDILRRVKELSLLFKERYEDNFKSQISEKGREVREKLRKGKKLKTEDILALQALDE